MTVCIGKKYISLPSQTCSLIVKVGQRSSQKTMLRRKYTHIHTDMLPAEHPHGHNFALPAKDCLFPLLPSVLEIVAFCDSYFIVVRIIAPCIS